MIVRSKLRMPPTPPHPVSRGLVATLGGSRPLLTTVAAPAGFGKTALLTEWARERRTGGDVVWLRLDDADRDPARFWAHLAAAARLERPAGDVADAVLDDLVGRTAPLVCVLDDVHRLGEAAGAALLGPLLDVLAGSEVRLVLAGRAMPEVSQERWRARHELLELGMADLLFSGDECGELLAARRWATDPDLAATLVEGAEGWPAVLELVCEAVPAGAATVEAVEAALAGGTVRRFVREEALAALPPTHRSLLTAGAELGIFDAGLCEAAVGLPEARDELASAWRNQSFLVPLADRVDWFRVQRLAAAALLDHGVADATSDHVELHRRAARHLDARGDAEAAVEHLLVVDPVAAARRMVRLVADYEPRGHSAAALEWFDRLPEVVRSRPSVVLGVGWALLQADLATEAVQWLDRSDPSRWPARHQVVEHLLLGAFVCRSLFQHREAVRSARAALEVVAGGELGCSAARSDFLHLMAVNQLIEVHNWHDEVAEVRALQASVSSEVHSSGNRFAPARTASVAAQAAFEAGDLGDARDLAVAALRIAARDGFEGTHITAEAELVLGELAEESDELIEARERLEAAMRFGSEGRWPTTWARAALRLVRVHARAGALDEAARQLEAVAGLARESGEEILRARVAAAELTLVLEVGQIPRAVSAYHALRGVLEPASVVRVRLRAALALGELAEVPRLIERLDRHESRRSRVAALLGRAALGEAADCHEEAVGQVLEGLRLAEAGRLWRPVADLAVCLSGLFDEVEAAASTVEGPSPGYVRSLRSAARSAESSAASLFSARELDLVALLGTRMNNEQLAATLFISENTVKTHLRHIYRKLGVSRRDEAVAVLIDQNMLDRN